jgi:hypothetical protein
VLPAPALRAVWRGGCSDQLPRRSSTPPQPLVALGGVKGCLRQNPIGFKPLTPPARDAGVVGTRGGSVRPVSVVIRPAAPAVIHLAAL